MNFNLRTIIGKEEFTRKEPTTQEEVIAPEVEAERNEALMGQREVNNVGPGKIPKFHCTPPRLFVLYAHLRFFT